VLVVEDGPTLTHGEMAYGAGVVAARRFGAAEIVDPRLTIHATPCDLVIVATPIDLRRVVQITQPTQRVRYELQEIGQPTLKEVLSEKFG